MYAATVVSPNYYRSDKLTREVGLGDLWDTIGKIAGKVSQVADTVASATPYARDVATGKASVAVVPRNSTSTVVSGGSPVAIPIAGMPSWVLPVGLGVVGILLLKRR